MALYHILYIDVPFEKRNVFVKAVKELIEAIKDFEGVEPVGLFFPRGSGYVYAAITKYRDYATWEKFWRSPAMDKAKETVIPIITKQMDMFFDEIEIE